MPVPRNETEIIGFLGILNYLSRFMYHVTTTLLQNIPLVTLNYKLLIVNRVNTSFSDALCFFIFTKNIALRSN